MQIVTDSGADLSESQRKGLAIHYAPLRITLSGKTYEGENELSGEEFYKLLSETEDYPMTSQASAGDFAKIYQNLAKKGEKILSVHISSGLSGTLNSAKVGAAMVPEADVTFWDTKTLSAAQGWQVQAAAIAAKKGWSLERILERLTLIRDQVTGMFTLKEMRYLIHGGRVSHLKGLMASVLNIKPVITVDIASGKYATAAQTVTFKRAIAQIVELNTEKDGSQKLRTLIVQGLCTEGIECLNQKMSERLDCFFEETVPVAPALGAHTGPSLTGLISGPMSLFADLL
jgi:DegV family protein with EDD domain